MTPEPQVQVTVWHAQGPSRSVLAVPATATILQVKEALVEKVGRGVVTKVQLAKKVGNSFQHYEDTEELEGRREFHALGLPSEGLAAIPSMSMFMPSPMMGTMPAYDAGSILTAVASVLMRESSSLDSAFMKRLAAESLVEVLSSCQGETGLRLRVRDASKQQGWVSAVGSDGAELWANLPPCLRAAHGGAPCARPYWPTDRGQLDEVDRECFGTGEQLGADWVRLAGKMPQRCFVSVAVAAQGGVVGYCAWGLERPKRDDRLGTRLYVASLAVHPSSRGKGIGTQLLKHVEAMGDHRFKEAEFVALHVRVDNSSAKRLYEKLGFNPVAVICKYNEGADGVEMVRELKLMRQRDVDSSVAKELQAMGFAKADVKRALHWAVGNRQLALQLLQNNLPIIRGASVAMPWIDEKP